MKKLKTKGFTLIELISVLVILAIILAIAVPSITGVIQSAKEKACILDAGMMEKAAKTYVQMEGVTIDNGKSTTISIEALQASKYLSVVLDPSDRKTSCEGYVVVTNNNGDYSYHASLKCSNTCKSADYDEGLDSTTSPLDLGTVEKNGDQYFEGANPNNWVKFGRMDQNDNRGVMWRIIKIDNTGIKMAYEGIENGSLYPLEDGRALIDGSMGVQWDSAGQNKWNAPVSLVGKLNDWLSHIYVVNMQDYLTSAPWKVGGVPYQDPTNLGTFLTYQDINSTNAGGNFDGLTNYNSIVGTINAVDFMYTSDNDECMYSYKETGSDNECAYNPADGTLNNFLQKDKYHWWTLNARSDVTNRAWDITNSGLIGSSLTTLSAVSVRPVLNLKLDTVFVAGTGTIEDPYILEKYMIELSDAPKITLTGDETVYIRQYDPYLDEGATAYDEQDGDLTSDILVTNTVNVNVPGTYNVSYNVKDSDGNAAIQVTRNVVVVERDRPIITLNETSPMYVTVKGTYAEPGATAYDINYGDISSDIVITGLVDTSTLGTYYIKYNVTNEDGIKAPEVTRKVIVKVPTPKITLNGASPELADIGLPYNDEGATATDEVDGDLTSSIITTIERYNDSTRKWSVVSSVSTSTLGTYRYKYSVTNSYGVNAFVYRTVNVVSVTGPLITFTPDGGTASKKTYQTTIGVTKRTHDIDATSLKYFKYSNYSYIYGDITRYFKTPYKDQDIIKFTSGTGYYYAYAIAKDVYGDTTMKRSKSFRMDNSKPEIDMRSGPSRVLLYHTYTDPGATAYDRYYDGSLTSKIITSSTVNTSVLGIYYVTYKVTDSAGNTTTANRRIEVYHPIPEIYLKGGSTIKLLYGTPYVELGATASDEIDGDLTSKIQITGTVDHMKEGTYTITYKVTNSSGYTKTRTRNVQVYIPDPVISLLGEPYVKVMIHGSYTDEGATATDTFDGNITSKIITTGTVNVDVAGKYIITYNVTNNLGKTTTKYRTVEVYVPTPEIEILGSVPYTMYKGQIYTDEGATATDALDGDLTSSIVTTGTVNVMRDGTYPITYTVTNSEGGVGTKTRNVIVRKSTLTVTPIGGSVTLLVGTPYVEQGATAYDELDGDLTSSISTTGTVNPSVVGNYTVTYSVINSGGDTKTATRSVTIRKPIVTLALNGPLTVELPIGSVYTDLGATATDELLGDVSSSIRAIPNINPNILGTYYVDYSITSSGVSKTARRTVKVVPLPGPIITFNPNGDSVYAKQNQTTVTVSKGNYDIDPATLKYLWKTDLTAPTEASFTSTFNSGDTIYTPTGVTGKYYLFILAKDTYGNTSILGSNGFNLDNTAPVLTLNGPRVVETPVDGTYIEQGASYVEKDSGLNSSGVVVTSTVIPGIIGTYTVTYTATDKAGNVAVPVVRTVSVIESSLRDAPGSDFIPLYDADYFVGADPHNWVEFGNAADNIYEYIPIMWRIIKADDTGIKIVYEGVKNTAGTSVTQNGTIGKRVWDDTSNTWNRPAAIRTVLSDFFTNLNEEHKDTLTRKINWCVGKVANPYGFDNFKDDACTTLGDDLSAIGLVNGKDYILTSKDPCNGYNQASCGTSNFLKKSYTYFTISGDATSSVAAFLVNSNGGLTRDEVTKSYDIRPVVNLKDDVLILGGEGTFDNPYKLNSRIPLVDNDSPIITFTPETLPDSTIVQDVGIIVTDDKTGVDVASLKYVWTTSSTQPDVSAITNSFTNGDKISLPTVSANYYLWVVAKDRKGNQTISKSGPYLSDNTPPIITMNGDAHISLVVGSTYSDAGATAMDDIDGNLTSSIVTTSNVNTSVAGNYTVTYTVTDKNGNKSAATRTIEIYVQTIFDYPYTGGYQTFIAPFDGYYKVDLWGAAGGKGRNQNVFTYNGGSGAFTSGTIKLQKGEILYVYVGGRGQDSPSSSVGGNGGWNGGGKGGNDTSDDEGTGGGAGATDIRLVSGLWNDFNSLKSRIMVAAGGAGSVLGSVGGAGGAETSASMCSSSGVTQTTGYSFGTGQTGTNYNYVPSSGGGGGYYGGISHHDGTTGGCEAATGGSSFVSGDELCNAISGSSTSGAIVATNQPIHYSGKYFDDIIVKSGATSMTSPLGATETGHVGDGYARISYIAGFDNTLSVSIIGNSLVTQYQDAVYSDAGATATDAKDGNITNRIVTTSNVNINIPGTYKISYKVTDSDGNIAYAVRYVKIITTEFDFAYTGNYQSFTAPETGKYQIELWGARGGYGKQNNTTPYLYGRGAYTSGIIQLQKGDAVYLYLGGVGGTPPNNTFPGGAGGWNGGGTGGADSNHDSAPDAGGGGGGATDVRLVSGTWNDFNSLKTRLMVAAGGGGSNYGGIGGAGGTLSGIGGYNTTASTYIPTQIYGNAFGYGMVGGTCTDGAGGGGGGYYGGKTGTGCTAGGAGGSSFVSGCTGCNAITSSSTSTAIVASGQPIHYSGMYFDNITMINGNTAMPSTAGTGTMTGNADNGYARVTYKNMMP